MMISIVVCTYNREQYFCHTLKSLIENRYPTSDYEILLVDNRSTDGTRARFEAFAAEYPELNLRYVYEPAQGISHARNRGLQEARGEVILYVDDDETVNDVFIEAYARFFELNPQAQAAGGAIFPKYQSREPAWISPFTRELMTGWLYKGRKIKEFKGKRFPGAGNSGFRKELFRTLGDYNIHLGRKGGELTGAEEKDLYRRCARAGIKVYYLPQAIVWHHIPDSKLTPEYFVRLTTALGRSERTRTLQQSRGAYAKRLLSEAFKWGASFVLALYYTLCLSPRKGGKLLAFRWYVTRGLLGCPQA